MHETNFAFVFEIILVGYSFFVENMYTPKTAIINAKNKEGGMEVEQSRVCTHLVDVAGQHRE